MPPSLRTARSTAPAARARPRRRRASMDTVKRLCSRTRRCSSNKGTRSSCSSARCRRSRGNRSSSRDRRINRRAGEEALAGRLALRATEPPVPAASRGIARSPPIARASSRKRKGALRFAHHTITHSTHSVPSRSPSTRCDANLSYLYITSTSLHTHICPLSLPLHVSLAPPAPHLLNSPRLSALYTRRLAQAPPSLLFACLPERRLRLSSPLHTPLLPPISHISRLETPTLLASGNNGTGPSLSLSLSLSECATVLDVAPALHVDSDEECSKRAPGGIKLACGSEIVPQQQRPEAGKGGAAARAPSARCSSTASRSARAGQG
jgi:hypothetical protein